MLLKELSELLKTNIVNPWRPGARDTDDPPRRTVTVEINYEKEPDIRDSRGYFYFSSI
jgi:hypothetical protein